MLSTRLGSRMSEGWNAWSRESVKEMKLREWFEEAQKRLMHYGSSRSVLTLD